MLLDQAVAVWFISLGGEMGCLWNRRHGRLSVDTDENGNADDADAPQRGLPRILFLIFRNCLGILMDGACWFEAGLV